MATWQQGINSGGFLAGIGGMNENAPRARDVNATLGMIRDNNDFARAGGNNVGLQALQGLQGLSDAYKQNQQAARQKAFQQEYGNAFKSGDRNAMRDLAAKYPDQFENVQKGMGFIDDDHRTTMGDLAMNAQVAAGQGPEAFGNFLKTNADELNRIGVNPDDVGQTYQQDPKGASDLFGNLAMFSLGPKGYLEALDKREGRDIDRGNLAETQRSNDMSNARGWANVDVARQNVALRKAELANKAIDQQIARETNQEKLADLTQKREMNQQKIEGAREQVRKAAINDYQRVQTISDGYDQMVEKAKSLQKNPALWRATGSVGFLPNVPGSEASNVDAEIESLKSQVAMQTLSAMKELSANGASGLGNASNREYQGLQSSLASLSTRQSPEQFKRSLQRVIDHAETAKNRLGTSFKQSYPDFQRQQAQTPQANGQGAGGSASSSIREGATATNPSTGQKIVFRGGQWQTL